MNTRNIPHPTDASIILTYRCPMKCKMCNIWFNPTKKEEEIKASDLRTLTWIYQEQSATLNRDEDGHWTLEGSEAAVQATRADSMVTALCSLTSNRVITGADPAQYGMTDPAVTVIYTLADGTENTLYFGDTNPVTGDVYLTVTEDSAVYTVSASKCNVFRYTAAELEDTEQSEAASGSDSQ